MNLRILAATATLLASCSPDADTPLSTQSGSSGRFSVARVGVFDDQLAYSGKRGVYVITDHETGAEYVGVSGVGISEIGSHKTGKSTSATDER